jgi:hypothetical protein
MLEEISRSTPEWFVIGDVSESRSGSADSVRDRWRRVIQVLSFNEHITDSKESFFQFREMDSSGKIVELDGEVWSTAFDPQVHLQGCAEIRRERRC